MKKLIVFAAAVICFTVIFAGCGQKEQQAESVQNEEKTAEQVVKEYFAYWGNRDKDSMDRLLIESQRVEEDDPDISLVTALTVNSCIEVADELKEEWDPELYPDPYDFTYVDVDFDIAFEGGEGSGYSDGNYQTRFFLIKETENAEWKIVTWGLG